MSEGNAIVVDVHTQTADSEIRDLGPGASGEVNDYQLIIVSLRTLWPSGKVSEILA